MNPKAQLNVFMNLISAKIKKKVDKVIPEETDKKKIMTTIEVAVGIVTITVMDLWTGKDKEFYIAKMKEVVAEIFANQIDSTRPVKAQDYIKEQANNGKPH